MENVPIKILVGFEGTVAYFRALMKQAETIKTDVRYFDINCPMV